MRRRVNQIIRPTVGLGCCLFYCGDTVVLRSWVAVAPVLCGGIVFSPDFVDLRALTSITIILISTIRVVRGCVGSICFFTAGSTIILMIKKGLVVMFCYETDFMLSLSDHQ